MSDLIGILGGFIFAGLMICGMLKFFYLFINTDTEKEKMSEKEQKVFNFIDKVGNLGLVLIGGFVIYILYSSITSPSSTSTSGGLSSGQKICGHFIYKGDLTYVIGNNHGVAFVRLPNHDEVMYWANYNATNICIKGDVVQNGNVINIYNPKIARR